jgi:hypothetical protein
MIEINLLRPRIKPPGWQSALEPRDWSAFISRRELVLAIVLLALGFSSLRLGFGLFDVETNVMGDQVAIVPLNPPPPEDLLADDQSHTVSWAEDPAPAEDTGGAVDPSEDPPLAGAAPEPPSLSTPGASPAQPATSQQGSASAEPPPGEPPASPSGGRLTQLRQVTQGNLVQVVVITDGTPAYKTFRVDNPNRVVIDIPGFRVGIPKPQRSQPISHPSMERVRVGQYQADPPVSRIVFDVVSFPDVQISSRPGSLRIRLSPAVE